MSDTPDPGELVTSFVVGAAFLAYAWHKRKTQFGTARAFCRVYRNNEPFSCHVCQGDVFQKREGLINTTWITLFKLDPFNESAHCLLCHGCGYVHWFARRDGVSAEGYLRYEAGEPPSLTSQREP